MSVWSRKSIDDFLFDKLASNWNFSSPHKLFKMDPELPRNSPTPIDLIRSGFFLRSDHATFWYHQNPEYETLNAILLCDMGPERGYQSKCYHGECDDDSQLIPSNLEFMKTAVDAVTLSVYQLATTG